MTERNRVVRLARRPVGEIEREDFAIADEPLPEPGEGEFRVHNAFVSLDPAMRGWVAEGKSYVPPVEIGAVMRAFAAGTVDVSNHPDFKPGDKVSGLFGAQEYAISNGRGAMVVDTDKAPLERWIGGFGMPGTTAYFGLLDIGKPKAGETVVVSAAAGAVGSLVGQIAKIIGARVVGIAGGPEKCRYVTEELGFDACVDYKAGNLAQDLKNACQDGIDVYFENVGGEVLAAVLPLMNVFGRIPVCGLISGYNATAPVPSPMTLRPVLVNRLTVRGFIIFDFADRYEEAATALAMWAGEGRLKFREDIRDGGLNAFPDVLKLLYTGGNNGKLILRV